MASRTSEIDQNTYQDARRFFRFDPFAHVAEDRAAVGASSKMTSLVIAPSGPASRPALRRFYVAFGLVFGAVILSSSN